MVDRQRFVHRRRREMRGERIGQAQRGGEARAEQAGAEDPHRHVLRRCPAPPAPSARAAPDRSNAAASGTSRRERVGTVVVAPQRLRRGVVGARRAAQAEVDAARIQRRQRAELLGDLQRRVVGQHDAARADADPRGAAGDVADQHRGGGAGDARHVVVLGQPVALVTQRLGWRARSSVLAKACVGVLPSQTGARSSRENGMVVIPMRCRRRGPESTRRACHQISTCAPSSTSRLPGMRKNPVAGAALRCISANSLSRQIGMPRW